MAARLEDEMRQFLECFSSDATPEPVLKAALAHLWFATIQSMSRDGTALPPHIRFNISRVYRTQTSRSSLRC